jgi:hypothetical protein
MGGFFSHPKNYATYKWTQEEMTAGISDGRVVPFKPGREDPDGSYREWCPICYLYYQKLNATQCCQQGICTECVFANIEPDFERSSCPFCRTKPIGILPDGTITPSVDDEAFLTFDARRKSGDGDIGFVESPELAPEMEAKAKELSAKCHLDIRHVRELLTAGVSPEEIEASAVTKTD